MGDVVLQTAHLKVPAWFCKVHAGHAQGLSSSSSTLVSGFLGGSGVLLWSRASSFITAASTDPSFNNVRLIVAESVWGNIACNWFISSAEITVIDILCCVVVCRGTTCKDAPPFVLLFRVFRVTVALLLPCWFSKVQRKREKREKKMWHGSEREVAFILRLAFLLFLLLQISLEHL